MRVNINKSIIILIIIFIFSSLTACDFVNEKILDELSIILAMSFDSNPENDNDDYNPLLLTTSNPLFAEEAKEPVRVKTVQGRTIGNALDNWQQHRNRLMALGKVNIMLFGENITKENFPNTVKDIRQIPEIDATSLVAYHPGKAKNLLYQNPVEDGRIAVFLSDMLEFGADDGLIPEVTLHELWTAVLTKGRDGYLPKVDLKEEGDEIPYISGAMVLTENGNKATTLNSEETKLLTTMLNEKAIPSFSSNIFVEEEEGLIEYSVQNTDMNINVEYNNEVSVEIDNNIEVYLEEVQIPGIEIIDKKTFETIAEFVAKDFMDNTQNLIAKLQRHKSDPIGIGQYVRIQQSEYYSKGTWRNDYPDIDIDNNYTVNVFRGSTLSETFKLER
ncbi:Ger(x)C family spore germination protein [Natranaerobius thermophilus]|uniref:Germination protein, Ger(X)C family n=1 Tax=Natranaerobius thermophilus (strain ATCC BAA-1301 / DSM 18059 / JW/NM-WN-LF) TaxID=457570 RepID=B2A182_NATTJ|nr:Ger(x)C family spore germination C-terminal domain-containing protein [Natranaerobius thermophilus]ACB86023.1 germination protein, Ger(x)C family [Natranaerobius thermophilus JW/NM-WN-LF]